MDSSIKVVRENDRFAWVDWGIRSNHVTKLRKYLCIGGPYDKQSKCSVQIEEDYIGYNASTRWSRGKVKWFRGNKNPHSLVWIHESLL